MNSSKHIIFRKFIAGGLLALLVFVYAEKFSHTHHKVTNTTEEPGFSVAGNNNSCAICDFTIAKDAAIPDPDYIAVPFSFIQQQYVVAATDYYYLPERYISNKGPPAC